MPGQRMHRVWGVSRVPIVAVHPSTPNGLGFRVTLNLYELPLIS